MATVAAPAGLAIITAHAIAAAAANLVITRFTFRSDHPRQLRHHPS